jgi:hypothetical protein
MDNDAGRHARARSRSLVAGDGKLYVAIFPDIGCLDGFDSLVLLLDSSLKQLDLGF